jgi:hypothetical protein
MAKSKPKFERHPLCVDLDAWLESEEGQHSAKPAAFLQGQYLQNRLKTAFSAGWNAGELRARVKLETELRMLKESRAAAVEQEQVSRLECNRLRQKWAKRKH